MAREVIVTRTRTHQGAGAAARDKELSALNRALREADRMDGDAYVRAVFSVEGPERITVHRLLPDGREAAVGYLTRETLQGEDSVDTYLLNQFGGPGSWILKPARPSPHGGGYISYGRYKRVMVGVAASSDAGTAQGTLDDADRMLAERTKRLSVLEVTRVMAESMQPKGGEEALKAEDFKVIAEALATVRGPANGASEAVWLRLVDRLDSLEKKVDRPAWEALIASLTPILTPVLASLKPGTLGQYATLLRRFMAPAGVAAVPERPWWEGIAALVREALASPALQPLIVKLAEGMQTGPVPVAPVAPKALAASSQEGPRPPAVKTFTDPDTLDAVNAVVGYLGERKFGEAWAVMRQVPDLAAWVAQVEPEVEPQAYWFGLKALDPRLSDGTMKVTCLEFIEHIQRTISEFLAAQEEAAAAAKGEEDGGKDSAV